MKRPIVGALGATAVAACGSRSGLDVAYPEPTGNADATAEDGASTDSQPASGLPSASDADDEGCSASGCQERAPAQSDSGPPATCVGSGGGGGGELGPMPSCTYSWAETCGEALYQVSCSCPEGDCVCFGPTTHIVSFPGCPHCPEPALGGIMPSDGATTVADVFARCGFPPWPGIR